MTSYSGLSSGSDGPALGLHSLPLFCSLVLWPCFSGVNKPLKPQTEAHPSALKCSSARGPEHTFLLVAHSEAWLFLRRDSVTGGLLVTVRWKHGTGSNGMVSHGTSGHCVQKPSAPERTGKAHDVGNPKSLPLISLFTVPRWRRCLVPSYCVPSYADAQSHF